MRYLVTGITGFAGPHLARLLLAEGHEVHGVMRGTNGRQADLLDVLTPDELEAVTFHYLDLKHFCGVQRLRDVGFDGVFHLAAQSHPPTSFADPVLTFAENVTASVNLITALGDRSRIMFCSTSEVYGNQARDVGMLREDMPLEPSNPYGCSKAAIDLYMQERMANEKARGFITRAFSHTGPRRGRNFSISSDAYQIARIERGEQGPVLWVGNLDTKRVVIDVRDCVRAYYLLMQDLASEGQVYNVAGDVLRPMGAYTQELLQLARVQDISMERCPALCRPIDIQVQLADTSKLQSLTGWKPEIPIGRTLHDLLDYWRAKLGARAEVRAA